MWFTPLKVLWGRRTNAHEEQRTRNDTAHNGKQTPPMPRSIAAPICSFFRHYDILPHDHLRCGSPSLHHAALSGFQRRCGWFQGRLTTFIASIHRTYTATCGLTFLPDNVRQTILRLLLLWSMAKLGFEFRWWTADGWHGVRERHGGHGGCVLMQGPKLRVGNNKGMKW